jgi:hypothetical protein
MIKTDKSQVWWCMSVIPALGRPRQEDCAFEVIFCYKVRLKKERSSRAGELAQG